MLILNKFSIAGLSPLTLSIDEGECIGLSGESGCGKTRLLRAIADLDEHEGELQLDNMAWDSVPAHQWRTQVALLPAESQWWFDSIGQHFSKSAVVLPSLGFDKDVMSWDSSRCSSGEKQRLSILRLLANKPRVLLLDEPTANLDETNSLRVEQLIADYIANEKAIVIWVGHNQDQLKRVSGRQFQMEDGLLNSNRDSSTETRVVDDRNKSAEMTAHTTHD